MKETSDELWPYVIPLLREMETVFTGIANRAKVLHRDALTISDTCIRTQASGLQCDSGFMDAYDPEALLLLEEIVDCIQMLSMRATHVRMLYESVVRLKLNYDNESAYLLNDGHTIR
jgi:hypothetical protein